MDPAGFALLLAAPLLALAGIAFALGLRRAAGEPFLTDYLAVLALSGLWGFVLWTFPGLIRLLVAEKAAGPGLSSVISTAKWFGFPFHLLQLYFMILTVGGMLGRAATRTFKRVYLAASLILAAALFAALSLHLQGVHRYLFPVLHEWVTSLYLAFQAAVYIWGLAEAVRLEDAAMRRRAAGFCGLYLAAFAAYYVLSNFGVVSGPGAGILFSSVHIPALILLALESRRRPLPPAPAPEGAAFEAFCDRAGLSPRERDIVRRLLEGQLNRQMENELFLSLQTIKNYISRIYKKFGVRNRLELMGLFRKRSRDS